MLGVVAARHDPHTIAEQVQRAGKAARFRRHRVLVGLVLDHSGRADADRQAQRQLGRAQAQGAQPLALLDQQLGRHAAGGPAGTALVDLDQPVRQLCLQIGPVMELADLEERALGPPDKIFDRALGMDGRLRPVQPIKGRPCG